MIGRDGTFNDDGRFHPLSSTPTRAARAAGYRPDGDLRLGDDGPPIPASGFTGSFLSAAGGCRENVPASTMSPQTRRRLRNVPVCAESSLRIVKYGFAGRDAVKIDYAGRHSTEPRRDGAYLFVLKPRKGPLTLTITFKDGAVCRSSYTDARTAHTVSSIVGDVAVNDVLRVAVTEFRLCRVKHRCGERE